MGKSSLIARFCDDVFDENMKATIGVAFKRKRIQLDELQAQNQALELSIWDFGGEVKYRVLFPSYVNGAAAALILYDTTDRKTLEDIDNWVKIIDDNAKGVLKLLIGTKIDLKDQREIERQEAREIAKKLGCLEGIVETSSKTGENVEEAFLHVARMLLDKNLQHCEGCGKMFSRKLKHCNHCGESIVGFSSPEQSS